MHTIVRRTSAVVVAASVVCVKVVVVSISTNAHLGSASVFFSFLIFPKLHVFDERAHRSVGCVIKVFSFISHPFLIHFSSISHPFLIPFHPIGQEQAMKAERKVFHPKWFEQRTKANEISPRVRVLVCLVALLFACLFVKLTELIGFQT